MQVDEIRQSIELIHDQNGLRATAERVEHVDQGALEAEVHASEEGRIERLVKFLRSIGAMESYVKLSETGRRSTKKYRLTEQVRGLYGRVVEDA